MYPVTGAPPLGAVQLTVTFRLETVAVGVFPAERLLAPARALPLPPAFQEARATAGSTSAASTAVQQILPRRLMAPGRTWPGSGAGTGRPCMRPEPALAS